MPLIHSSARWMTYWQWLILACAIWNSLSIPVAIAFKPSWSLTTQYSILDNGINFIFLVDIIIAFNTIYVSFDGEEVTDRWKIAKKYLTGMFFIDLISTIPFDLFPVIGEELSTLNLLKVIRISRLTKMINRAQFEVETKAVSAPPKTHH